MNKLYNNDQYRNPGSFVNRMGTSHMMKVTALASLFVIFCTDITSASPLKRIDDSHIPSPNRTSSIATHRKGLQSNPSPDRKSKIENLKSEPSPLSFPNRKSKIENRKSEPSPLSFPNRKSKIENLKSIDSSLAKRLQSEIEKQAGIYGVHGISASAFVPGKGKWIGVTGVSSESNPMRPEMILGAGSITKTFTAALILQLAEEGKLTLDDSLHEWLPTYPNIDGTITIRQLLNHTGGIYNYTRSPEWSEAIFSNPTRHWEPEEIVAQYIKPRVFQPGKGWDYTNTGYLLLGMIAEQATSIEIATELRTRFLEPLGLTYTHLEDDEESGHEMAHPWAEFTGDAILDDVSSFPRPAIYSTAWTAGAMFSNASDLVEWGRALYGGTVLHDSSLRQMLTFRNLSSSGLTGYGLGALRVSLSNGSVYGHDGAIIGYSSVLLFDPVDSIVVAALVNEQTDALSIGIAMMEAIKEQKSGVDNENIASGGLAIETVRQTSSPQTFIIDYQIPEGSNVSMTIYNILGKEVATVVHDWKSVGAHTAYFDGSSLPHGPYFCRLQAGGTIVTKKIVL